MLDTNHSIMNLLDEALGMRCVICLKGGLV